MYESKATEKVAGRRSRKAGARTKELEGAEKKTVDSVARIINEYSKSTKTYLTKTIGTMVNVKDYEKIKKKLNEMGYLTLGELLSDLMRFRIAILDKPRTYEVSSSRPVKWIGACFRIERYHYLRWLMAKLGYEKLRDLLSDLLSDKLYRKPRSPRQAISGPVAGDRRG